MTRIISWNMNHWRQTTAQHSAAWNYLKTLNPDFALLQEIMTPNNLVPTHYVYWPIGDGRT